MLETNSQQDRLKSKINQLKLIRLLIQFTLLIVKMFFSASISNLLKIIIISIFTFYIVYFIFCTVKKKNHILHSFGITFPDIICTVALIFLVDPFIIIPFIFLLTTELLIDKHKTPVIVIFTTLSAAALIFEWAIKGDIRVLIVTPLVVLSQLSIMIILRIQSSTSKMKYEYMKKLVDNKNKLLSTLTHELRTPLAVIKTSNELVMEERPGPINETQRSLIHSSIENTKRLIVLVENILSHVKVEFAWFTMKQQPLDIRKIIRETAHDIKPYLDTKQQTLKYNYPSLLSKTIGDKRWIGQVLLNLIHNGSKNSPEGTEINIGVQQNEQCIVVSVHDRGSGIEDKEISHVFDEFYQSTDPNKDLNEGAGLGLTIVKDIIQKHKGEVYISSIPRAGTTVSFTLPLYKGVLYGTINTHY